MFEIFGPIARPTPSWLPLALALLPLVGAGAAAFGEAARARRTALVVLVAAAAAALVGLAWMSRWPSELRLVLSPLGVAARIGQLELVLALALGPFGALASAAVSLVAVRLVAAQRSRRRIGWLCATTCATQLVVLADGAATLVLALGLSALAAGALGYVQDTHFVADRVAEVATIFGAAVLFWALGGSWIEGGYVPELDARVVVASGAPAARSEPFDDDDDERPGPTLRRGARSALSMGSLPGAAVLVDGAWLRDEHKRGVRAPFADVGIPAGPHTLRLHVGPGSDDYFVPRIDAPENATASLAIRGSTTTFREIEDDLVGRDAAGDTPGRAALARRKFFGGIAAAGVALGLFALAFLARMRAFPFAPSSREPARALVAFGGLAILARYPIAALAPSSQAAIATALAACAVVAAGSALRTRRTSALLAAEMAFAGAGVVAGAPAIAVVHAAVAALAFARPVAPPGAPTHVAFWPTRVAVVGACAGLAHGAAAATLALVAVWVAACALARTSAAPRRAATLASAVGAVASLVLALDPRIVGSASVPVVDRLLASSFAVLASPPAPSVALVVLTTALVAFAYGASRVARASTLDRLAASPVVAATRFAGLPARGAGAVVRAAAAALVELESRAHAVIRVGDALVRGAASLASLLDDAALVSPSKRLRVPIPSERTLRLLLVPLAIAAAAVFVVPWAS